MRHSIRTAFSLALAVLVGCAAAPSTRRAVELEIRVPSRADGSLQPARLRVPAGPPAEPAPLLVFLHSWSRDYAYREESLEQGALDRGWYVVAPNFRGPNDDPAACGSALARQDILDAVDWVCDRHPIDRDRVYLTGVSGGGHMTLLMVARHPEPWAAASAWVPPTDLVAWHDRHANGRYGEMIRAATGGAPGTSPEVDREYRERSPVNWLAGARGLPVEIAAGIRDGHDGSVPIAHTLRAFNVLARANGGAEVSEEDLAALSVPDGLPLEPLPGEREDDPALGRAIRLRRSAGPARVTIFEGGHEWVPEAVLEWLARHRRR